MDWTVLRKSSASSKGDGRTQGPCLMTREELLLPSFEKKTSIDPETCRQGSCWRSIGRSRPSVQDSGLSWRQSKSETSEARPTGVLDHSRACPRDSSSQLTKVTTSRLCHCIFPACRPLCCG